LIKVQAQIDAKGANDALLAQLAELQTEHGELQQLVLAMHDGLSQPHEAQEPPQAEAAEPVQEAPHVEAGESKPDPIQMMMQGHTAALQSIAEALKRSGGPKRRTIQTDAYGKPVGIIEEDV
jgi:hypothetical protein